VLGGFHLKAQSNFLILQAIHQLKSIDVQGAAPCHCSGNRARILFKKNFAEHGLLLGVGDEVQF
jgi:7,8-dihydropterin-6-yl-methyl-4-(beta-D-ribofuranosyl)aminobenzene 5'-phosphate synthase